RRETAGAAEGPTRPGLVPELVSGLTYRSAIDGGLVHRVAAARAHSSGLKWNFAPADIANWRGR
ncbi:MAG: hypothetical protein WBF42_12635, partial [Terracidiphilus sp.]